MPQMIIVAGPPGGGKSTAFPVSNFGIDFFNADNRAAELNKGSFKKIDLSIRAQVNREFEKFIAEHINEGRSFAFETTLRTDITLQQAAEAQSKGFAVAMRYVALENFRDHLERVAIRADGGGHSASEKTLRKIYDASIYNLPLALRMLDDVRVYDNTAFVNVPRLLLQSREGNLIFIALEQDLPDWLPSALRNTEFEITPRTRMEAEHRSRNMDSPER